MTIVDRRRNYYSRLAASGFDSLDFYTRAEKGRKFIAAYYARLFSPTRPALSSLPSEQGGSEKVVPIRTRKSA
jgi:hypothetical protein